MKDYRFYGDGTNGGYANIVGHSLTEHGGSRETRDLIREMQARGARLMLVNGGYEFDSEEEVPWSWNNPVSLRDDVFDVMDRIRQLRQWKKAASEAEYHGEPVPEKPGLDQKVVDQVAAEKARLEEVAPE